MGNLWKLTPRRSLVLNQFSHMCLWPQGEEANEDNGEQTILDPKWSHGGGRCKAGKCTGWLTQSGKTEHPGQACPNSKEKRLDTGEKRGNRCERAQKAVKNALKEELIAKMYEMIL